MIRFLTDENFNGRIVRGLLLRDAAIDILRIQDTPLFGADDPVILEWAATEKRVLLTHDVRTITDFAYSRVRADHPMAGVLEVPRFLAIGAAIEDLLLIAQAATQDDFEDQVRYLPL